MPHGIPTKGVAFFSSVTGSRKETDFGPSYWVSNLVSQVKFSAATEVAAEYLSTLGSTANTIVEVGPHSALSGPLRQSLSKVKSRSSASFKYNYYPCLVRNQNAVSTTLTLGGKLFELGSPVNLDAIMESTSAYQKDNHKPQVVDTLPSYPWDHRVSYWHESRLSKGYRQRPFPYHDLLGLFDVNSSPYEPRWRYHVSLEALPWLRDHVVEGFVIFPGVGYITMVIEAMKQLFQIRKTAGTVKTISFRDVTFARPVVVPSDNAKGSREVELQLIITPSRQHIGSSWEYFHVLSYDPQNDSWVDNCTGLVSWESSPDKAKAEKDETVYLKEDGLGHLTKTAADEWLREIRSKCSIPVNAADIYNDLASSGNQYGLSFQGLKEIHVSKNLGFAKIVVDDIAQQMPGNCMQVHTIHPTAFDSMVQLEAVIFRRECTAAPMMPVMLGEVSVAVDMDATPGTEFFVALQLVPESRREATADFCAYQRLEDGTFRPVVTASKIRPQTIGDANLDSASRKTTYRIEWKPDVGYVTQDSFMDHVSLRNLFDVDYGRVSEEPAEVQLDLNNAVATYFVCKTVKRLRETNITSACSPHLSKLLDWMLKWNESEAAQYLSTFNSQREEELINRARSSNIVGLTLTRLGPRYFDILTGTADALELLIQDDLLGRLYSENTLFNSHYAQMAEYMAYLVHKSPSMNIIEIGAGTGGATMPLLKRLERDGRLLLDSYTYTDISSGFFERARTKFNTWSDQITFKTLDISRDPLAQGYTPHSFDLVVASMVLHATPMMDATMSNVRKLLKPGGRLVLLELTAFAAMQNGIFGTLEGWWMSEDGREDGPILTVTEWDAVLKRHGFQGVDLAIPAYKGRGSDVSALIIAQASLEIPENKNKQIAAIQLGNADESQIFIGESLCVSLNSKGINCSKEAWGTTSAPGTDKLTIVIDSAEHPVLLESNHEKFHQLKELLLHERQILWVSFQSSSESAELAALKNMINGLARVIRRENPDLRLITVDVQDQCQGSPNKGLDHIIETITEVAASSFWSQNAAIVVEFEYAILDGKLVIPRVIPDDKFARYINSRNPEQEKDVDSLVECKYLNSDRALVFDVQVPGLLNTIRFIDNEEMSEPLASGEIQVQARAHGLNFKDVFIALGQMAAGTIMAGEMAGVITAIGPDVQSWKVGDRVTGFMAAPFGNQVRINSNKVVAIPDSVSFTEAASITIVFYTAWYCLIYVARLEKGQTVLIHAASGGVGQAAIQLAKHVGAEIFATVSSADKSKLIQEQYGIPKTHIFSSHSGHFKKQIMDATKGRGVDVVLNSLSGQMLMDSWDCVAQFGTFLEIGKADIYGRSQLNMANFEKQATFAAVDVSHINRLRPEYVTRGLNEIYTMVDQDLIKPVYPVTTYSMDKIEDAFRLMAARKHVGKLVLVANDDTLVKATKQKCPPLRLHKEGTYVISGGVGDLGKRMGRFLAEKGAGHIVALTRRHLEPHQRAPLEQAISDLGSTLHIIQCDITDGSMTQAVAKALSGLPPVRGVIQSALVLCDHPLEYMELEDWKTAVEPKVQGTMNLHQAFCSPESTDFFIMLSSVASILGSNSQSNYAAGNAFQDAFAHAQNEHSRGITHYTTINIGGVEGSEQVARALDQNSQIVQIIGSVSFDEVLATLEYAMGPQSRADEAAQCLMYFNRDSMEDGLGPSALGEPLYGHVPSNRRHGERAAQGSASDDSKQTHARAAEQADSIAEAEDIVKDALVGKFAAFIGDDVPDNQPIAVLGLDSLVSIELKNWVKHMFQTPLQTSELSGARSITALAQLIVSRMDLKCKPKEADRDGEEDTQSLKRREKGPRHKQNGVVNGNGSNGQPASCWTCCKVHEVVSAQPLPDLDDSFDYWLEANEHLFSSQELKSIHQDIQNMRAPNSTARHVLRSLLDTHKNDDTNGWFTDAITDARFLQNRGPIAPYSSIMGGHRDIEQVHNQSERAAIITSAVMSFKRAMDAGLVEPLDIGGKPECTWGWAWLFHSTRVPQLKCDKMVRYMPESASDRNHIAVLRKGRLFKVMLQNEEGEDVSLRQLRNVFEAITAQVQGDMECTGILTTDNRDSWAKVLIQILLSNMIGS
jgi:NADPH:quinone reductase-like Zn-dependent oxidoreductase/NAD(P)-dependent dehydrogenase (short-subunit alcohol dehydrogenase family)/ubiquinone/menaquinone biosynthesis C-methylase UbiE/acyl carrier protein